MQAIVTKYLGPTNTLPSRIRVAAQRGRKFVNYDCGLSAQENHRAAAIETVERYGWGGTWVCSGLPDGASVRSCVAREDITADLSYLLKDEKFFVAEEEA